MRWPDIFFKAKPRPSDLPAEEATEVPTVENASPTEEVRKLPVSQVSLSPAPVHSPTGDTAVIHDMAEADTLRQLSRSGGVRLIKRDFFSTLPKPGSAPSWPSEAPAPAEEASKPPFPATETPGNEPPIQRAPPSINLSGRRDDAPASLPGTTIFKRRTKMADVARIVLPPRREDPPSTSLSPLADTRPLQPAPSAEQPPNPDGAGTIFPATFPVSVPAGSMLRDEAPETPIEEARFSDEGKPDAPEPASPFVMVETEKDEASGEALMPEAVSDPVDEAETPPALLPTIPAPDPAEKKEFILSNGERILGHILSETSESIYLNHATLGVLTIPRAQIAQRPVEIILMNGDRIVGDILAETVDSLFVRHASLGVLTVPKNQRSTRVVEAILKDGDRILGEVLGETGNFTVIRSATLGTVAVPHNRVALLNRRAEEVQMKALPPANPAEKNQS